MQLLVDESSLHWSSAGVGASSRGKLNLEGRYYGEVP